jgi:hypothetical protein
MAVHPLATGAQEDGAGQPLADSQVDGSRRARRERHGYDLATLALDGERAVARSSPRASMSAPIASETRKPFSANSEMSACSTAAPSPAATSRAPTSLRSRPMAWLS